MEGESSEWVKVESSVPQGTVTGPLDCLLFISDLPERLKEKSVYLLMIVSYITPLGVLKIPKNYKLTWIGSHGGRISGK